MFGFADLLSQVLGQALGEVLGESIEDSLDRRKLQRELAVAVSRAETRFAKEFRTQDAELADTLTQHTRFADLPSVRAALREMLTNPFRDSSASISIVRRSFTDVLPEQVDRSRVDAAVQAFLHILGEETLAIPLLHKRYMLFFQKTSAESTRRTADQTGVLVDTIRGLRADMRQLTATPPVGLLADGAPTAERPRPRHNLPQRNYTQFIGRLAEIEKLTQLMLPHPRSRHFVVTLDGIGGVGKSALALELAHRYRSEYETLPAQERFEAIIWASAKRTLLTAGGIQQRRPTFNTLDDLYREIVAVLEQPGLLQSTADQRRAMAERALSAQRTLLIIDNLETVDDEELLSFLRELPDPTKAIITTRHRIDIAYTIRLTGMPRADAHDLMELEASAKDVALPATTYDQLFHRTGGIPLAIVWSIGLISVGHSIDSVLRRLGSGHNDITRFCFAESMATIHGRDAQRLLLALALFERSVNRQMLGEVAGLQDDIIGRDDGLAELLRLSFVDQKGDRFKLLPLTHSFALDELSRHPELERELREQWVSYLSSVAQNYGGIHWRWRDRHWLQQEGQHVLTLAEWAQRVARPDVLLEVLPALCYYFDLIGQWADAVTIGKLGIEYARVTGDIEALVFIEHFSAWILSHQGHHQEAEQYVRESLSLAQQLGDPLWICSTYQSLSQILRRMGAIDQARLACAEALVLLDNVIEQQRPFVRADIAYELGKIERDCGNWDVARTHFLEAQSVFRYDDDKQVFNAEFAWGLLSNLGVVAAQHGQFEKAMQYYQQCLAAYRQTGGKGDIATLLVRLALLEEQRGNHIIAIEYAREALELTSKLELVYEQGQAETLLARLEQHP
ncbi:MAG: tetratricopeptide repeat protein [Roseiflexaceae bacterium]|nr:tetratricopeptide repeat protein [Roseiflexaceae bacterium]